jgi:hypothetical protein
MALKGIKQSPEHIRKRMEGSKNSWFKLNHKTWNEGKGKIWIDEKGYAKKSVNNKHIRLHRLIWEQYNCKIPEGYDIHHINGNKLDNRIENLQMIRHNEHTRLHRNG